MGVVTAVSVITSDPTHQRPIVCRMEAQRCRVKSACINFPCSPLRASIKFASVLKILTSTSVSPTTSARLSLDIPHVYMVTTISLPFISVRVILRSPTRISPVIIPFV